MFQLSSTICGFIAFSCYARGNLADDGCIIFLHAFCPTKDFFAFNLGTTLHKIVHLVNASVQATRQLCISNGGGGLISIGILEVGHPGIWSRDINILGTVLGIYLHFLRKIRFFNPIPGLIRFYEISICHVLHCPYTPTLISSRDFWYSPERFVKPPLIHCICIEVKDKHRVSPQGVKTQSTEYFGLYRNSQLHCDVTPTSRMFAVTSRLGLVGREATTITPLWPVKSVVFTRVRYLPELVFPVLI